MSESQGFHGRIGLTHLDSVPHWAPVQAPPASAPNVVYVVLDDVGFADLGCFGSEIDTPTIDGLAAEGLRYVNFHATPLCSPTRASLLTGRNHHSVGMRLLSNLDTGYPNGRGHVTKAAATLAEMLVDSGYNTMCVGKWHLAPMEHTTASGPYDQWPLGRGFERYYGFLEAETDCFYPELYTDNHAIEAPGRPEDGYHLTTDLVDQAISLVRAQSSVTPEKPFFLHLAFAAAHAPHQAPQEYLDKYRGRYDEGWDVVRETRFRRQKELGLIPPDTRLPPRNDGVVPWADLTDDEHRLFARLQEAYAAMLDHTDAELRRFVEALAALGRLDNTMIVLMSDNGASQEGGKRGSLNPAAFQNGIEPDFAWNLEHLDEIGGPRGHSNYPWGWAQAGNTPFRRYKQNTHEGGVRVPLIVRYPNAIANPGEIRSQFHHVTDITPTVLDIVGVQAPEVYRGVPQLPLHGTPLTYTFGDAAAPTRHRTQYFEMFGHRAIWHDGWKAVAFHQRGTPYEDDRWELFDTTTDWSESDDVAERYPDKLAELQQRFWAEAGKYDVLPLDDRGFAVRAKVARPGSVRARRRFVYYRGMPHLPAAACPPTMNRSHRITAFVDRAASDGDGVLVALGGVATGFALFVKDGQLVFDHNYLGRHTVVRSESPIPVGTTELAVNVEQTGDRTASVQLLVGAQEVASTKLDAVLPHFHGWEGLDIGQDGASPVSPEYDDTFPYQGRLDRVEITLEDDDTPLFETVD
ncbi:arylsulfatase [Kribbella antiqua]|uniref:Arylsulfatase n=1 Tax=Kribbella antiqua TaxID=2512217 RepID=A0A4R2J0S4_9ACTN|nr:arylsulfatase [Kribbella antiqua]TCO50308.1 arylsulfatase [Kribbella antiqua]